MAETPDVFDVPVRARGLTIDIGYYEAMQKRYEAALDSATQAREEAEAERDAAQRVVESQSRDIGYIGANSLRNFGRAINAEEARDAARAELAQLRPVVEAARRLKSLQHDMTPYRRHLISDAEGALWLAVAAVDRRDTPEGGTENG